MMAVDPGKNGGVAVLKDGVLALHEMPRSEKEAAMLIVGSQPSGEDCVIERVTGWVGRYQPSSRMFNFGWWTGGPIFAAHCGRFNVRLVMAHKWQRDLGLKKKEFEGDWKKELLRVAKIEAEKFKVDGRLNLRTCDALLLLTWGLRAKRK